MKNIGFKDKNGDDLKEGHKVRTFDKTGKEWTGLIAPIKNPERASSPILRARGIQYAFRSNYDTWINDQKFASELEIIK